VDIVGVTLWVWSSKHVCVLQRASGLWGALMVFVGLVGATIGGVVLDMTKLYKEVTVVTLSLGLICFIWFVQVCVCVHARAHVHVYIHL